MNTRRRFSARAHILAAVPGSRFTTHSVEASFFGTAPLQISCRFTWTIAMEPRRGARITNFANRLVLETLFRDTRKH